MGVWPETAEGWVGWHTTADALLANTAAANARAQRRAARDELSSAIA